MLEGYVKAEDICIKLSNLQTELINRNMIDSAKIVDYIVKMILKEQVFASDEKPKWIRCSERYPQGKGDICKNVIIAMKDGAELRTVIGWINDDTYKMHYIGDKDGFIKKDDIRKAKYWMPLPEPPEVEE